jgi:hypothetical protein
VVGIGPEVDVVLVLGELLVNESDLGTFFVSTCCFIVLSSFSRSSSLLQSHMISNRGHG